MVIVPIKIVKPTDDTSDMRSQKSSALLKKGKSIVLSKNINLDKMEYDFLYHLGLTKENADTFKDIKYVCIGGTNDRMTNFANRVGEKLCERVDNIGIHKRYVLYHVGPVLVCSHGMGGPSISILLNEIAKLLKYAGSEALWIRLGTCGGIGVNPGSLCISSSSVNGALEPYHETIVLGKRIQRPAVFDEDIAKGL